MKGARITLALLGHYLMRKKYLGKAFPIVV